MTNLEEIKRQLQRELRQAKQHNKGKVKKLRKALKQLETCLTN